MSHLFSSSPLSLVLSLSWFQLHIMYRPLFFVPSFLEFCCCEARVDHMIAACEWKPLYVLYKVGHRPALFSLPRVAFLGRPLFLLNPG